MSSLEEQRARIEHALNTGQGVRHLGEPGVRPASPEFLTRLDELPPSARRLALAKACALPWKDDVDELPDCYLWELRRAIDDWDEDRAAYPDADETFARIFEDVPEPISAGLLRQIVDDAPSDRRHSLMFALVCSWPGGPKPVLTGAPEAPRWLVREWAYTAWAGTDAFRARKAAGG